MPPNDGGPTPEPRHNGLSIHYYIGVLEGMAGERNPDARRCAAVALRLYEEARKQTEARP